MKCFYVAASPEVSVEDQRMVSSTMASEFGLPVREIRVPSIDFAYDEGRRQYRSVVVLEMLARLCPDDASKLLALTERDLFVPVLTFVYGQAQLNGRVAVFSLSRLRQEFYGFPPDREALMERAAKEALHEAGHLFGLVHCTDRTCAMSLATNVRQIDSKQASFCAPCRARLARTKGVLA
ncbi:MAG TPA: archaemetzincin family Zn-dependent metalloprotease [Bryobacteraceae bacterium]|nr:archaemetzincin family Zn-dependent metalloprotease [Bryobacteraceae bacterium]